jgi:hypothetical protein
MRVWNADAGVSARPGTWWYNGTGSFYFYIGGANYTGTELGGLSTANYGVLGMDVAMAGLIFAVKSNSPVIFGTSALERVRILGSGQVGIGTTTPSAKLAINGGLAVGEDADPGDNNLKVVGDTEIDGAINHDGTTVGFYGVAPATRAAHIVDADGSLADITTKFNTLLVALENIGILNTV